MPAQPYETERQQRAFLAAFSETGVVRYAAAAAGVNRRAHARWLEQDPEYALAFHEAQEEAADVAEAEARRRAIEGVDEPVFYKGEQISTVRRYSDNLLMFILKGRRPLIFGERVRIDVGQRVRELAEARGVDPDAAVAQLKALVEPEYRRLPAGDTTTAQGTAPAGTSDGHKRTRTNPRNSGRGARGRRWQSGPKRPRR